MEEKNKEVMINSDMKSSSEILENEYRKSAEEHGCIRTGIAGMEH